MIISKTARKNLAKRTSPPSFGRFFRAARTMQDKNQTEMADFLGISKSSLCDIEKGRHFVSIDFAVSVAKKCGLSETMAIKYAIQDQLRRAGLNFDIELIKKSKHSA